MTNLKFLALHDCNSITNNGITAMSEMKNLNTLSLRGCRKLTNNGMKTISVSRVSCDSTLAQRCFCFGSDDRSLGREA
jgi:hypothetical protein